MRFGLCWGGFVRPHARLIAAIIILARIRRRVSIRHNATTRRIAYVFAIPKRHIRPLVAF